MQPSPAPWRQAFFKSTVRTSWQHSSFPPHWRGRCLSGSPATGSDTVVHHSGWYTVFFGYFSKSFAAFIALYYRSVARLLCFCRPCAVLREIAERVVSSLYSQVGAVACFVRPISKILELVPRFAYGHPLATIVFVSSVSAPPKHVAPTRVQASPLHPVRGGSGPDCRSGRHTAARLAFAVPQISAKNCFLGAADTYTAPHSTTALGVSDFIDYSPSAELLARHVNEFWVAHYNFSGVR